MVVGIACPFGTNFSIIRPLKGSFLQRICTIFHNQYPAAVAPIKEIKSISTYVPNAVPTTLPDHELRSHPSGIPASFTISPNNDTDKGVILSGF